jgi:hypothetical protein
VIPRQEELHRLKILKQLLDTSIVERLRYRALTARIQLDRFLIQDAILKATHLLHFFVSVEQR